MSFLGNNGNSTTSSYFDEVEERRRQQEKKLEKKREKRMMKQIATLEKKSQFNDKGYAARRERIKFTGEVGRWVDTNTFEPNFRRENKKSGLRRVFHLMKKSMRVPRRIISVDELAKSVAAASKGRTSQLDGRFKVKPVDGVNDESRCSEARNAQMTESVRSNRKLNELDEIVEDLIVVSEKLREPDAARVITDVYLDSLMDFQQKRNSHGTLLETIKSTTTCNLPTLLDERLMRSKGDVGGFGGEIGQPGIYSTNISRNFLKENGNDVKSDSTMYRKGDPLHEISMRNTVSDPVCIKRNDSFNLEVAVSKKPSDTIDDETNSVTSSEVTDIPKDINPQYILQNPLLASEATASLSSYKEGRVESLVQDQKKYLESMFKLRSSCTCSIDRNDTKPPTLHDFPSPVNRTPSFDDRAVFVSLQRTNSPNIQTQRETEHKEDDSFDDKVTALIKMNRDVPALCQQNTEIPKQKQVTNVTGDEINDEIDKYLMDLRSKYEFLLRNKGVNAGIPTPLHKQKADNVQRIPSQSDPLQGEKVKTICPSEIIKRSNDILERSRKFVLKYSQPIVVTSALKTSSCCFGDQACTCMYYPLTDNEYCCEIDNSCVNICCDWKNLCNTCESCICHDY